MSERILPNEVVVLPLESTTPELRAALRERGFFVPPRFARAKDGAAPVRRAVERDEAAPLPQVRAAFEFQGDFSAPPEAYDAPTNNFANQDAPADGAEVPTGAYGAVDSSGPYPPAEAQTPAPAPAAAQPPAPAAPPPGAEPEPATMQIDFRQAAAMAGQMVSGAPAAPDTPSSASLVAVGESTTQASHRVERLDLSDWGYLLRIVMIAEERDPEPTNALNGLRPTIGQWLKTEIQQPARLEYDRRFRRDIEKQLAKFLTQQVARFPVIKADIQFIE